MANGNIKNHTNIEQLLAGEAFPHNMAATESLFEGALQDELIFHYEHNSSFRQFCDRKKFNPYATFSLDEIPPVAVSVFKELGPTLASVPMGDIKLKLQSSATSGTPSTIVVDKTTSK